MENAIGKIIEILLVEDNPGDVDLIKIGLEDAKVLNKLHVVTDGLEAMKFLRGEDIYANAPCPDLILLDLNLPRKSGKEVLQEIKVDPKLQAIPVVILTSSEADEDICRAYELHANCYISKPVDFEQFVKVVQSLEHFWFTVVKLPGRNLPPHRS